MLRLHRRHLKSCSHKSLNYRRCKCPVWIFGTLKGERIRESLDTTNWERGEDLMAERIARASQHLPEDFTIEEAGQKFYDDCAARGIGDAQLGKYKLLKAELTDQFGTRLIKSITVDDLRSYRASWKLAPVSASKKVERLKTFFQFCQDSEWIGKNPAKALIVPRVKAKPTLPFSDGEMEKLYWAIDLFPDRGLYAGSHRNRIRAFLNVLRYTGLRIRDVTTLSRDMLEGNKLYLYPHKTTDIPVFIPLPKDVVESLDKIDNGQKYYFWSGNGDPKSGVSVWQRTLAKLFKLAGITNGHAHRFRDTFSVNLLQKGVSLESVSVLLGHSNTRITARHYAPWVRTRQLALEAEIQKAWAL